MIAPNKLRDAEAAGRWLRKHLPAHGELSADSRTIKEGDGFIAWPGLRSDGRRYVAQACANGAAAVLFDEDDAPAMQLPVPGCSFAALRQRAGAVSAAYYEQPSRDMTVYAVTGTNGKTTVANWLAAGAAQADAPSAAIGTLGVVCFGLPAEQSEAQSPSQTLTTPDAVALQRTLSLLKRSGIKTVALEASSIGLEQVRIQATHIDVAIFTNLSRDHLDYHGDMTAYLRAKQQLFAIDGLSAVVVNSDDPACAQMLSVVRPGVRRLACGLEKPSAGIAADTVVTVSHADNADGTMRLQFGGGVDAAEATVSATGAFNALNAAAVCAAWHATGLPFEQAVARLDRLQPVAGRMQLLQSDGQPLVVVDYAHTPDALLNALTALQPVARKRGGALWVVFGCGGDRDTGKRALMGEVALANADHVVLTDDNPRTEDPQQIISQIAAGMQEDAVTRISDRRSAIEAAVLGAKFNDLILVAGKGHETYQEIGDQRIEFSDWLVCQSALRLRQEREAHA